MCDCCGFGFGLNFGFELVVFAGWWFSLTWLVVWFLRFVGLHVVGVSVGLFGFLAFAFRL